MQCGLPTQDFILEWGEKQVLKDGAPVDDCPAVSYLLVGWVHEGGGEGGGRKGG